ncbi:MAG TPA: hypothetical protein VFA05_11475 [Gaiellaceae bacterium]|nr:hypothetical protein [Gaiellaceae bacterium]
MRTATGVTVLIVLAIVFGTIYAVAQHVLRSDANDPQIELAEQDAAAGVGAAASRVGGARVDLRTSLAPFELVFSPSRRLLASSGRLDGRPPRLPGGVLAGSRERRFTWQPAAGVRLAAVVAPARGGGWVLVARSLREVEKREHDVLVVAVAGFVASLVVAAAGALASARLRRSGP